MTSSRIFKILAALTVLFAGATVWFWHASGEAPSPIIRLSAVSLFAALVVGLTGTETRPQLMLRFLAALFTLVALIALAADLSRPPQAGESGALITLQQHLQTLAPALSTAMERWITHTFGASAWSPFLTSILSLPASLTFFALGVIAGIAGRPRQRVRIYVNDI